MQNFQNNQGLTNPAFVALVLRLQKHMPVVGAGLLVFTYLTTAVLIGVFLGDAMSVRYGWAMYVLAVCVGLAVQLIRGTIVFFNHMNPGNLTLGNGFWGPSVAVVMALFSGYEIYELGINSLQIGWGPVISFWGLMGAGLVIEIFLLKQTNHIIQAKVLLNDEYMNAIREFHNRKANFKRELRQIERDELNSLLQNENGRLHFTNTPTLPAAGKSEGVENHISFTGAVQDAIRVYGLNAEQIEILKRMKLQGLEDYKLIKSAEVMAENPDEKPSELPLDFSANGKNGATH